MKIKVAITRTVSETREFEVEVPDGSSDETIRLEACEKAFEVAANTDSNNPGQPEYEVAYFEPKP